MSENEQKTDKKLFQKDGPGGPGRGNVKNDFEGLDFWDATETLIRNAMGTGKTGDKLKAAKLYLQWQELKKKHDKEQEQTLPDSNEIERIRELLKLRQDADIQEGEIISDLHCPHCGEKFVSPDEADGDG